MRFWFGVLAVVAAVSAIAHAQIQMPDPRQMAGIPRPVSDLPNRTVSVRLIRGSLSTNIPNFPVELHVGSDVRTTKTDEAGRAQFGDLPAGATLKAVAVVDGERLESESFPAPKEGGIRLMLVATDTSKAAAAAPSAPAVSGQVTISGQSRIIVQPGDEVLAVYYLLDIVNNTSAPVEPSTPFTFDMPAGATRTSLLEGSSPQASVKGLRVTVAGPFAPGATLVQVACELAVDGASLQLVQRFPAALERLAVITKKVGDLKLVSPQIANQQDMTASGETFIAATGGSVAVGQPLELTFENLPHHSAVPRWIALSLAGAILICGVWLARADNPDARADERKKLLARREKLFADLVRLEHEHRIGKVAPARYAHRREELFASLEHVYGVLDSDEMGPGPSDRSGLAA